MVPLGRRARVADAGVDSECSIPESGLPSRDDQLVTHYWGGNDCFLAPNQILDGMDRLAEIPAILVHGRYDISGPLDTAWTIHQRWPGSQLVVLDDAGHGGGGFNEAIVEALNSLAHSI